MLRKILLYVEIADKVKTECVALLDVAAGIKKWILRDECVVFVWWDKGGIHILYMKSQNDLELFTYSACNLYYIKYADKNCWKVLLVKIVTMLTWMCSVVFNVDNGADIKMSI